MSGIGRVLCPVLVGRDELLELADRRLAEVAAGHGQVLFLSGGPGLGKTRLLRSIARKARAAGFLMQGGSVSPHDFHAPLQSIREMAASMRNNPDVGTLHEDLLQILDEGRGDGLAVRRQTVVALAERILAAVDRPMLLVFEDLHWTDEVSLEVVGELARHAADRPLFVMADYRADEFPPRALHREWRARLLSQRIAEEVTLRRLTLEETGVATSQILGGELPAPRDVVEAIYRRTNGIPLHIEELVAALDDEARADGRRIMDAHVPDTIGDAVLARLDRLSGDARTLARAGAVVGRCFTPDVVAGMVDRPLDELEPVLDELVEAAILHPYHYVDQGYYDFRHQLLRDAIYGAVPPSQLRRFHAQAAEFVMTLEASNIVHASGHYERAGLRSQAFRTALAGAAEAKRMGARSEQFELLRRAIDNIPADLSDFEKAELYEKYSNTAMEVERLDECRRGTQLARDAYLAAGRPDKAAATRINLWSVRGKSIAPGEELVRELDELVEDMKAFPQTAETAYVERASYLLRALTEADNADFEGARASLVRAREMAVAAGDKELALDIDLAGEQIDVITGRAPSTMEAGFRAADAARDAGFESVGVTGYRNLAIVASRVLDYETARRALAEGLRYADAIEASHCRQQMAVTKAHIAWVEGRWAEADMLARQELVERGCRLGALDAKGVIACVATTRGDTDVARPWVEDALAEARVTGWAQRILPILWTRAELELAEGNPEASLATCEDALTLAVAKPGGAAFVPFIVTGTRAAIAARRPEVADRWVDRAREPVAAFERVSRPAVVHATGLVHLAAGSVGQAREALSDAIDGWVGLERAWEAAWARIDLAQCLLRINRYAEAAALVETVRGWATEVGSRQLIARADELARAGRGRGAADEPWRPLTIREFEVAQLIAAGMTNQEIADELSIAPKTASAHVEHILAKLGVTRRAEIAAWTATVRQPAAAPVEASKPLPTPVGAVVRR